MVIAWRTGLGATWPMSSTWVGTFGRGPTGSAATNTLTGVPASVSRLILAEAAECVSKDIFKDLVKWALQSESRSRVEAAMFFAKNMLALDNRRTGRSIAGC